MCLRPDSGRFAGNILTPMVRKNFEDDPKLQAIWERENMVTHDSLDDREEC